MVSFRLLLSFKLLFLSTLYEYLSIFLLFKLGPLMSLFELLLFLSTSSLDHASANTYFFLSSYKTLTFRILNSMIHLTWQLEEGSLLLNV